MSEVRGAVVVKLGGTTLADQQHLLADIAATGGRHDLVLVHGGGNRLTEWLARLGVQSRFEDGLRVTDDAALDVALAVFGGLVNGELVAALNGAGVRAVGLTGIDGGLVKGRRVAGLGRVVTILGADPAPLLALLGAGLLPVVAPLALDEDGNICNVNADEVAGGLAGALSARLVLLTDTDGVLDARGTHLPSLDSGRAGELIGAGVIRGGMLPKIRGALDALRAGASEVVIADGRQPAALSRALGDRGFGTRLVPSAQPSLPR